MTPHPRVLAGPITPDWLVSTAESLSIDINPELGEYHMLSIVITSCVGRMHL